MGKTRLRETIQGAARFPLWVALAGLLPFSRPFWPTDSARGLVLFEDRHVRAVRANLLQLDAEPFPQLPCALAQGRWLCTGACERCRHDLACAATGLLKDGLYLVIHCAEHVAAVHFSWHCSGTWNGWTN